MFTIFFTADIQGSTLCWNKLINAADLFRVDALIVSGNLTGKLLLPIVREKGDTWRAALPQASVRVRGSGAISVLEERLRAMGSYPCRVEPEEALELEQSPTLRQKRLEQEAGLSLRRWLEQAEKKLKKSRRRLIMMPGDDDPLFIEEIIRESSAVEWARGEVIPLTDRHKLISEGSFHGGGRDESHRLTDEALFQHLQDQVREIDEIHASIFNLQLPPLDATLFDAPRLNCGSGSVCRKAHPAPAGCAAIGRFIETYQPLLSLHGYTHGNDNKFAHIGRTLCCVPGNGHAEGLLCGFLITLKASEILDFQPIHG